MALSLGIRGFDDSMYANCPPGLNENYFGSSKMKLDLKLIKINFKITIYDKILLGLQW